MLFDPSIFNFRLVNRIFCAVAQSAESKQSPWPSEKFGSQFAPYFCLIMAVESTAESNSIQRIPPSLSAVRPNVGGLFFQQTQHRTDFISKFGATPLYGSGTRYEDKIVSRDVFTL
jgi:hypothetical protein